MAPSREQPEQMVVKLRANASPRRVVEVASMLQSVLDALAVADDDADITLVVSNKETVATLRGWDDSGRNVIRDIASIVENPALAVEQDHRRVAAVNVLAEHAWKLAPYGASFHSDNRQIAQVDQDFIESMRAAVEPESQPRTVTIKSITGAFATVLRVGRQTENSTLYARMRLDGAPKPKDIEVPEALADHFFDAAKNGKMVSVTLICEWKRAESEAPKLINAKVVDANRKFEPWSGARLLKEASISSVPLSREDYDAALRSLRMEEHE